MRKRLILHIGMHKTGSTSIQRYLSRNRRLLRLVGIHYPETRGPDGRRQPKQNTIFTAISHEADFGAPHPDLGPAAGVIDGIARQIERARARTAILSAEGLSGERPVFAAAMAPLAQRFDVTVVIFLRRPDLWVESFYKQMVFSRDVREVRSFEEFLSADDTQAHLDYGAIIGWWAEAFGWKALRIAPFEPEIGGAGPAPLFLETAGLPRSLVHLPFARAHLNPAPSNEATEVMRRRNLAADAKPEIESVAGGDRRYFPSVNDRRRLISDVEVGLNRIPDAYPLVLRRPLFMQPDVIDDGDWRS
ncbi:MAG: hypothetical protein AAF360_19175 [Pseudomonadota bacterium]